MSSKLLTVLVFALGTSLCQAEPVKLRYQWSKGHVFTYQVEQFTQVVSTMGEKSVRDQNQTKITKEWTVLNVDENGTATLQLKLPALQYEISLPNGEKIVFDSKDAKNSNPQLEKQLRPFINAPVAVLRINNRGRVLSVDSSKFGPASRYQTELPFVCELPNDPVDKDTTWHRKYEITLEPPQGTGEKFPAAQHYVCKSIENGTANVQFKTVIDKLPEALLDRIPLIQSKPKGMVDFDVQNGRYLGSSFEVKEEIQSGEQAGVQKYQFHSTYRERLISHK